MIDSEFWHGKKVFLTGHTGFKGSWLSLWLHQLGARVSGYALDPPTRPSLFELARVGELLAGDIRADVRDPEKLKAAMAAAEPEIVFHLAAQPLVRYSYQQPVETYTTNVLGTVHLLEAVRHTPGIRAVVNVTTDKCYENREWVWGYRENEPMGGYDPYSSSKGCAELVTAAYRSSYFSSQHGTSVATARAGNVIGGGDWAADRLIPDCLRALLADEQIVIRNPRAIRPWQHVLEPLSGYLLLAEKLHVGGPPYAGAWNFGPLDDDARPVEWIVRRLCAMWGASDGYQIDAEQNPHEAHYLKLDISKARMQLGWQPSWNLEQALAKIVEWTRVLKDGGDLRAISLAQIAEYLRKA
jgi:CDP-glucose 4,6-dehydratase